MSTGGVRYRRLRPIGKMLAEDTRRHHRSLILQHLFAEGPASRADLARATGLTRVTVSDLVVRMSPLGDDVVLTGTAVLVLSGELGVS